MLKKHKALVVVEKLVCPECRSENVEVRSSPKAKRGKKVRYCKCETCGATFKDSEDAVAFPGNSQSEICS